MKCWKFRTEVWLYPGMTGWHFLSVPKKTSEAIKKTHGAHARGWGSLPVEAVIGKTRLKPSIFPDRKAGAYLLPLKAEIRKKEGFGAGDAVAVHLTVL